MPLLARPTHKLYYETVGKGVPVLLTHGYSASHAMWRDQVSALGHNNQILTWDMHGHGATHSSDRLDDYSEQNTVDDMAAILDACATKKAVVGGLSLGGYMSLAFYRRHPDRVAALMLFDTGPGFKKEEARAKWNATAARTAEVLETKGIGPLARNSAEVRMAEHKSAQALALAARGMLAQVDDSAINSLPEIRVPTLVLAGANDKPFLAATDYMVSKIPNATKVIIDGAGHAANIDQPEAFNAAVKNFLSSALSYSAAWEDNE